MKRFSLLLGLWTAIPVCFAAVGRQPVEDCERGPPPGAADFSAFQAAKALQRERLGYDLVCESLARSLEWEVENAKAYVDILPQLGFMPLDLGSTPFVAYRLLGASPEMVTDGRSAALHRYFQASEGQVVDLYEWDLSLGGAVWVDASRQTERIGERRGQLTVLQSNTGYALSDLSWTQNNRRIELRVNRNAAAGAAHDMLVQLAESLPAAVAARAEGAPPPRPAHWPEQLPWPLPEQQLLRPPIPPGLVPADTH